MFIHVMNSARITPFSKDISQKTYSGAVYKTDGHLFKDSLRGQRAAWQSSDLDQCPDMPFDRLDKPGVYLGHMFGQYGHFLLETLTQLTALKYLDVIHSKRIFLHPFDENRFTQRLDEIVHLTWNLLGHAPEIVLCTRPIYCDVLLVASRLVRINEGIDAEDCRLVRNAIAAMFQLDHTIKPFRKIFLHPSVMSNARVARHVYQATAEQFSHQGWEIVDPCSYTLFEQARMLWETQSLAGFSGSSLHNAIFMQPGTELIEFGDSRNKHAASANQIICNTISGVSSRFVEESRVSAYV